MATTNQSPPFNPEKQSKPELAPNNYGKPMQRPMNFQGLRKKKRLPGQEENTSEVVGGELKPGNTLTAMPQPYPMPKGGSGERRYMPGSDWNGGGFMAPKPGSIGPGGQDPFYGGAGQGPSYGGGPSGREGAGANTPSYGAPIQRGPLGPPSQGKPPQGAPQPGGGGRQPLRPGMEYRPGGGQRPVGGRPPRGFPQDGGQQQASDLISNMSDDVRNQYEDFQSQHQMTPEQNAQWSNGQLEQGGPEDEMNQWRRRLKGMQQAGPNMNQFYGAF